MKRNRFLLGLALVLAGAATWAWAQSPYNPRPAPQPPPSPVVVPVQEVAPLPPPAPAPAPVQSPSVPAPLPVETQEAPPVPTVIHVTPETPVAGQPAPRDVLAEQGLGQTADNPTGRQEPSVSIEWIGPPTAKLGQPVAYQILIKNISLVPLQQVQVKVPMPQGAKLTATEPKAVSEGDNLCWTLGALEPREEKRLDLQLVPEATGSVVTQASVSIQAASAARLQVYQPKLVLKATAPEKVIMGDPATIQLTVHNPGDAAAEHVKLVANLTDGLEHARGKTIEFDMGNLAPKESRSVQVLCSAKTEGLQKCEASASAEPGLTAQDTAPVEVLMPKIEVSINAPGLRYLDRRASITFKVTNPGTAPANHVTLVDTVPPGFKFISASNDGRHDFVARTVTWSLGDLAPQQSQEVTLELVAVSPGEHKHHVVATAARGLKAEGETVTRIEGLPALLMELVDLDDPLEVNGETAYEIRVTNTGTKTETNLQLTCTIPDKMEFKGARSAAGLQYRIEGKDVVFEPLPKLAPRADAVYRVNVKGTAAGDLRFRARIKADGLADPVLKEESTKVYGDEVQPVSGPR